MGSFTPASNNPSNSEGDVAVLATGFAQVEDGEPESVDDSLGGDVFGDSCDVLLSLVELSLVVRWLRWSFIEGHCPPRLAR